MGTEPGEELLEELVDYFAKQSKVETLGTAPAGVELMTREDKEHRWLFVINHTNEEMVYNLHDTYIMLEGEKEQFLKPYEIQLFWKNIS